MTRPRIVYFVTRDLYFLAHRLPTARAAYNAGYDVHVVTSVNDCGPIIRNEGFELHTIDWRRGSINPIDIMLTIGAVRRIYRRLKPDLAHFIGLQLCVVGSLAAWKLPLTYINSFAGLGYVFISNERKARTARVLLTWILPRLLSRPSSLTTTENQDDLATLVAMGTNPEQVIGFPGSGVDTEKLSMLPEPSGTITAAFVGRMIEDKGVRTLVEAVDLLAKRNRPVHLLLAGAPDQGNPDPIPLKDIEVWQTRPGIRWLGHVSDISTVWAEAHIAVLPSRGGEGVPVSLLESAACGRPLVATDVPGCREIARHNINALLVPRDDPVALADAIDRLAQDGPLRRRFGAAGRRIVVEEFSSECLGREMVALYDWMIDLPPRS